MEDFQRQSITTIKIEIIIVVVLVKGEITREFQATYDDLFVFEYLNNKLLFWFRIGLCNIWFDIMLKYDFDMWTCSDVCIENGSEIVEIE